MSHYGNMGGAWAATAHAAKGIIEQAKAERTLSRPSYKDLAASWKTA